MVAITNLLENPQNLHPKPKTLNPKTKIFGVMQKRRTGRARLPAEHWAGTPLDMLRVSRKLEPLSGFRVWGVGLRVKNGN